MSPMYPIGRIVGSEIYASGLGELYLADNNKILTTSRVINKGEELCFLKLIKDYDSINFITRTNISDDFPTISLIFSFGCIYRHLVFEHDNYTETYAQNMHTLGEHIEYISGGEQINNQQVSQTMVCAVFE